MKDDIATSFPAERRSQQRIIVNQYHSVELLIKELVYIYRLKIWNISSKGMCVLIKEDSVLLNHLKPGEILDMKYYSDDASHSHEVLKTKISHVEKDERRFKGHYMIGLSILGKQNAGIQHIGIERRAEPRTIVDQYYSVQLSINGLEFDYQFKIWDISSQGMCILIKKDSNVLNHLNIGAVMDMKYSPIEVSNPPEVLKTKIMHITKDSKGRFKEYYMVGLSILTT